METTFSSEVSLLATVSKTNERRHEVKANAMESGIVAGPGLALCYALLTFIGVILYGKVKNNKHKSCLNPSWKSSR